MRRYSLLDEENIVRRLVGLSAACGRQGTGLGMADATDDKKLAEAIGADAAYDVLEKDFQEVSTARSWNKALRFRAWQHPQIVLTHSLAVP